MDLISSLPILGCLSLAGLLIHQRQALTRDERGIALCMMTLYGGLLFVYARSQPVTRDVYIVTSALITAGLILAGTKIVLFRYDRAAVRRRNLKLLKRDRGPLHELVQACHLLALQKTGALFVLERKASLDSWRAKGIPLDAAIGKELLFSIFTPPGDLHDGAVLIHKGRIASAAVILPLTGSGFMRKDLGTRHRAALGMSEHSDAVCLVVSEETRSISLADNGYLHYDIPHDRLAAYLYDSLRFRLKKQPVVPRAGDVLTKNRTPFLTQVP